MPDCGPATAALPLAVPCSRPEFWRLFGWTGSVEASESSSSGSGGATELAGMTLMAPWSETMAPLSNGVRPPNGRPVPDTEWISEAVGEK